MRGANVNQCLSIHERTAKSQVYTLMLGSRNIPVYCHMGDFGCGGGGWTPVMKTDGTEVKIEGRSLRKWFYFTSLLISLTCYRCIS